MTDPIKIMDEITIENSAFGSVCVTRDEWFTIRTAIERQAEDAEVGRQWREDSSLEKWFPLTADLVKRLYEELAQARARIARLDDSHALLLEAADKHLPGLETLRHQAERVMYETDRKSHAAVKAEALREAAKEIRTMQRSGFKFDLLHALEGRAARIEREAKEES